MTRPGKRPQRSRRRFARRGWNNVEAAGLSPALKFEPNTETGVVIIKVLNRETGEVIRQLPPEAVVKAAEDGGSLPSLVDTSA